jgi:hypothetical protein
LAFQPLVRGFVRAIALSMSLMMRFRLPLALERPQRPLLSAASLRARGGRKRLITSSHHRSRASASSLPRWPRSGRNRYAVKLLPALVQHQAWAAFDAQLLRFLIIGGDRWKCRARMNALFDGANIDAKEALKFFDWAYAKGDKMAEDSNGRSALVPKAMKASPTM